MPAAPTMAALLDTVVADRARLRDEPVPELFLATVRAGIDSWAGAVAAFDAGGDATTELPVVSELFAPDPTLRAAADAAKDSVAFGVGKPIQHLVVGLLRVSDELVRENRRPVAMVRRAAAMERKATSRWRGADARAGLLVDRDLVLEEARVEIRLVLDDAREVADIMRRWRSQPVA